MEEKHSPALEVYMLTRLFDYTQTHSDGFNTYQDVLLVLWLVWF